MINEDEDRRYMSSVAPPTEPGLVEMPRGPSNWPKVVGIIAIVLGAGIPLGFARYGQHIGSLLD